MERGSSGLSTRLNPRDILLIAIAVFVGIAAYVASSALTYRVGFPLDDSWIHAAYARNLALHGKWEFQLGHLAAGSTSPLWTFLLVPGFWLGLQPIWWSLVLGAILLYGLAVLCEKLVRTLIPAYAPRFPWIGLFFACEWHMLWAASAGMETLLHALLLTAVMALVLTGSRRYLALGLVTSLSVWVRPDGLTLVAPVLLAILATSRGTITRVRGAALYAIGLASLLLPYLLLNLLLSGTPMPNTFYAKQIEYAAWQARPFVYRLGVLAAQLLTGPAVMLLPGVIFMAIYAIRRRSVPVAAALAWCIGYFVLYISRLPAYQHGRYLMPAMPTFIVMGFLGLTELFQTSPQARLQRVAQEATKWSLALLTVGFLVLGARAYGQDVGLIESEMVNTASWTARNIPAGDVIAAHDIGALGYFDDHPLVDLAGLVSPEVLPFMRDQARLAAYLDERQVRYLIAFPNLYPDLVRAAPPVFSSGGRFAPAMGQPNLTVYCWSCP
jgi:hypothetical protein